MQQFLIENSYFTVGKNLLHQNVRIPMAADLALFWANLNLYKYEFKYVTKLKNK